MNHPKIIIILLFVVIFFSCDKESELETRDYPFVVTNDPIVQTDGVILSAEILNFGNQEILNYGFVWDNSDFSSDQNTPNVYDLPTKQNTLKLFHDNAKKGIYTFELNGGLLEGSSYTYRAFIQTGKYDIYGPPVTFKSNGSRAPEITDFNPKTGSIGTKVTITGNNFSYTKTDNILKIGDVPLIIESADDNKITATIPKVTVPHNETISIETAGMNTKSKASFDLKFPWTKIETSSQLNYCDTYFQIENRAYLIKDNDLELMVYNLKTQNYEQKILLPEMPGNSPIATSFNNKGYVLLENNFWEFNPVDKTWVKKSDFPGRPCRDDRYCFFTNFKNHIVFVALTDSRDIWDYDVIKDSWEKTGIFPLDLGYNPWGNFAIEISEKAFVGIRRDYDNEFGRFDPETKTWYNLGKLPINSHSNWGNVLLNDKIYLAFGQNHEWPIYSSNEIWEFNPANKSWTEYNHCPEHQVIFASFTYKNKAYFYSGKNIWEFDPSKN